MEQEPEQPRDFVGWSVELWGQGKVSSSGLRFYIDSKNGSSYAGMILTVTEAEVLGILPHCTLPGCRYHCGDKLTFKKLDGEDTVAFEISAIDSRSIREFCRKTLALLDDEE